MATFSPFIFIGGIAFWIGFNAPIIKADIATSVAASPGALFNLSFSVPSLVKVEIMGVEPAVLVANLVTLANFLLLARVAGIFAANGASINCPPKAYSGI